MINPIMAQMNNQQTQQLKQLYQLCTQNRNPQSIINMMLSKNPMYKQVSDIIQQNGGNAKNAFYNLSSKMGVNPQQILDIFK